MRATASGLVVPDVVAQAMARDDHVERQVEHAKVFNGLLRDLDRRLSLIFWPENLPAKYGSVPGRFHVRRDNSESGLPATYMAITNPDGSYREPNSGDIERLRRSDLWNPQVSQRMMQPDKPRDTGRDERREHMADVIKTLESPGVSFSDVRWRNKKGR